MLLRHYTYLTFAYAFALGLLYVWGYWSPFGINALDYMGFEQIATSAIFPLASTSITLIAGIILGELRPLKLPPGSGAHTTTGRFYNRHLRSIGFVYLIGVLALVSIHRSPEKWYWLPVLLGFPVYVVCSNKWPFTKLIPHDDARSTIVLIISILPFWSYGQGQLRANDLQKGRQFESVVDSTIPSLNSKIDNKQPCRLRLIGRLSDFIFVMQYPEERLTVVRTNSSDSITTQSEKECGIEINKSDSENKGQTGVEKGNESNPSTK